MMIFLLKVAVVMLHTFNFVSSRSSAANSANWHAVVLKPPQSLLSQQVDYNEFEDSVNNNIIITVSSTNAGMV